MIRSGGGSTFAERPDLEAPDARIIWHADLDPATLRVVAVPAERSDADVVDPAALAPWLSVVSGAGGEHVVLSDGWHHIRLDVEQGSLSGGTVILHYQLHGIATLTPKILPLRRLLYLCRHRHFAESLYPKDNRVGRWLDILRVHDAIIAGASQRDIAIAMFGRDRVADSYAGATESLRSRVRRLVRDARDLAAGGYRQLLRRHLR